MSDANQVALRYAKETTFGVDPTATMQNLRFTSESLRQDNNTTTSNEIVSDRQIADVVRLGLNVAGDINFELSYDSYDDLFEAALQADSAFGSIGTGISAATTISVDADGGTGSKPQIADSGNGFTTANGFADSQWVKVSGFTEAANNGIFKIQSSGRANGAIDLDGGSLVDEAAGDSVTVIPAVSIDNGTTLSTFHIEREYTDLTNEFELLRGVGINTMALNVGINSIITGAFGCVGKDAISATSTASSGTASAVSTTNVMDPVAHVDGFWEGDPGAPFNITQFSFNVNNNLRAREQVGSLGAISLGSGTFQVEGTLQAYYTSKTIIDKFLNHTATGLALAVDSGTSGNAYVFDFPQVRFTSGQRTAGGLNQDVFADLGFTAYKDGTAGYTVRISRFADV